MAKIKLLASISVLVIQLALAFGNEEPPVSNKSQLQLTKFVV